MAAPAAAAYIEPRPPAAAAADNLGYGRPAAAKRAGSQSLRLSCPAAAAAAAAAMWLLLLLESLAVTGDERPMAEAADVTAEWHKLEALKERPLIGFPTLLDSLGLRTGLALTLPDPNVPADSLSEARPVLP